MKIVIVEMQSRVPQSMEEILDACLSINVNGRQLPVKNAEEARRLFREADVVIGIGGPSVPVIIKGRPEVEVVHADRRYCYEERTKWGAQWLILAGDRDGTVARDRRQKALEIK